MNKATTILEKAALEVIVEFSASGGVADINDLPGDAKQMRGAIASLQKKGLIEVDTGGEWPEPLYWPVHSEHGACFLCDYLTPEELQSYINAVGLGE